MPPLTIAVIGAGSRGTGYAEYALENPEKAKIVGAAEPRDYYRESLVKAHNIPAANVFKNWREAAKKNKFADAVIIATQDQDHADPAVAFAEKGYHILLEKPMAPTEADCRRIIKAVTGKKLVFAVCHVMRYTVYTRQMKALLDAGRIGQIVSMQHLEPVGYWHQAHSFVRGNWRNETETSFMLLAKSCHDVDWIRYIMNKPCRQVSSFGGLYHFHKRAKPAKAGAAKRCTECAYEPECPYSAVKIYMGRVKKGHYYWPVEVLTPEKTPEAVEKALREGPYGRCVYECDNDVVDHQVVNMVFEGGETCAFTMTAFTEQSDRKTRIFGTRGQITGDGRLIEIYDFLTQSKETIDVESLPGDITGGHGGGDTGLMSSFVEAAAAGDQSKVLSGPQETLESHLMVFAAERARREGKVVSL